MITAARLVKTPRVAAAVARRVGAPSVNAVLGKVTVTPLSQSNIITDLEQTGFVRNLHGRFSTLDHQAEDALRGVMRDESIANHVEKLRKIRRTDLELRDAQVARVESRKHFAHHPVRG